MTTKRLACLALLAVSTPAAANVVASDPSIHHSAVRAADEKPAPRRVEGRLGMMMGGADVGDADGFSIGITGGLGYRIGDITLRARLDHYRVGDSAMETLQRRGRATRAGGLLRYSFVNTYDDDRTRKGLAVDFWGEAGVGFEHVAWRQGGVLDRPSGELAFGVELDGFGKKAERTGRRRHVGYFMAFRSLFGEGPEVDGQPAMCGGPCTKATRPSRIDVSMFFELGLHWGR